MDSPKKIRQLADTRIEEAEILLEAEKFGGAKYLAGYAIELTLKAKVFEHFQYEKLFTSSNEYRKYVTKHDFDTLLLFAGLHKKLNDAQDEDKELMKAYSNVSSWDPEWRYSYKGDLTKNKKKQRLETEKFISDVKRIRKWIENAS
jgi:hypothetical protein